MTRTRTKLVRDKVPAIIRARGGDPRVGAASEGTFYVALRAKLYEEVNEFLESGDPVELADIMEVVLALGEALGVSPVELENLRIAKVVERGAFRERVLLEIPIHGG